MDEASRFIAEYHGSTNLTPGAIGILVLGAIATFLVPRRFVFVPLVLVSSIIADSQRVVIAGADFAFMRLMVVLAWGRLAVRSELRRITLSPIDMVFAAWILWRVVAAVVRTGSFGPLVNQLGHSLDAFGIYFLARMTIRGWRDLDGVIVSFAAAAIPVSLAMTHESVTGWNVTSVLSGLRGIAISRDGEIRAMCGYAHPIIAGAFWAGMLPLLVARYWNPNANRTFVVASVLAAFACVVASASSTPLLGVGFAMIGAGTWQMRRNMNVVRWAILGGMLFLEVAMEKPIWHLFQRVSALGLSSSTGYHRYRLFDAFVRNFTDWAPIGLDSTAYWGRQLDDVTNTFIVQAVRGGLVGLVLILVLFFLLYQYNGRLLRLYRNRRPQEIYLWALGVSLFTHTAMMNAMGYLSQMLLPWYVCFAMIAAAPMPRRAAERRRRRAREEARSSRGARPAEGVPA